MAMNPVEKTVPDTRPLKTGELLIQDGLVRTEDVAMALSMQEKHRAAPGAKKGRLLGMILCDLNLITPLDNYYTLHRHGRLMSLESALVSTRALTPQAMAEQTRQAEKQGMPLISQLLKSGQVSSTRMQKVLFSLFHIPFRSISDFIFNEKDRARLTRVLDMETAEKHRMIPLVFKENTILFGITSPDNILVVRALNDQFPQYRFKALFIPFSGFSWFSKIIYGDPDEAAEQAEGRERGVDLSLLLNFQTEIGSPELEKKAIWILYERYELLRRLTGKEKRGNFQDEFNLFIQQTHSRICREYGCGKVVYSLSKEAGGRVRVTALPVREAD